MSDYCVDNANNVVSAWWELGDQLLVKYNHFRIYDPEKRKAGRASPPQCWLKAVVEYDKLEPLKPPPPPPPKKSN